MIKNIFFDLDGTLLPMNQDEFTNYYFSLLAKKLDKYGYPAKELISGIWYGTKAMVLNNGEKTNEDAFWDNFEQLFPNSRKDEPIFTDFYKNEFKLARPSCGFNPLASEAVKVCKEKGYRLFLATNPIFPSVATDNRIEWAGLDANDFEYITTYENCNYSKPNPNYFLDICQRFDLKPEETLMVGNDVSEDMIAQKVGLSVYLVTDCLENKKELDYSSYQQGSLENFIQFIKEL